METFKEFMRKHVMLRRIVIVLLTPLMYVFIVMAALLDACEAYVRSFRDEHRYTIVTLKEAWRK